MLSIHSIFLDNDGTLFSHSQGGIPSDTREAIEKAREKGVKVFLATGRHWLELQNLSVIDLELDGYVTVNGQICLDKDGKVIFAEPIPAKDTRILAQLFRERRIPLMFVEDDRIYMNMSDPRVERAQGAVSSPVPSVEEYNNGALYQAVVYLNEQEKGLVADQLKNCRLTRWHSEAIDIAANGFDKVAGIRKILQLNGLPEEGIMAFGDGENDIEMIQFADIGVAMGNAGREVKEKADYVTADIDDGGILKALEHFHIL